MAVATPVETVFDRTEHLGTDAHEQVVFCRDHETGLRAIIALHSTRLGPALGGTRCYPYKSEEDALTDVLRLSRGMTFKAAAAGMNLGGGKAVILGDPNRVKTPNLLRAYGRFVDSLHGRYYTAADVGTTADDLDEIGKATKFVVGTNTGSGDSGFSTALGVFAAMRAAAEQNWGETGLTGRTVGVEGVGKVGAHLVRLLLRASARVTIADPNRDAVAAMLQEQSSLTARASVIDAPVDVYAPCALGASLTPDTAARVQASVVCGAANNQLLEPGVASLLAERGVTWVPDYIANAGGLIQVGGEISQRTLEEVHHDVTRIKDTVRSVLTRAATSGELPGDVANQMVTERLAGAASPLETLS